MTTVLVIAGSLRHGSYNRLLLRAAVECAPQRMTIRIHEELAAVPPFDADLETGLPAAPARRLDKPGSRHNRTLVVTPPRTLCLPIRLRHATRPALGALPGPDPARTRRPLLSAARA